MTKRYFAGLAILTLAACARTNTPPPPTTASAARPIVAGPIQPPPVYALLGQREKIGLTSAQVTALDSIGGHVNRANEPLMARLRELRGQYSGRRNAPRPNSDELQPTLDQLRRNNQQASDGVRALLTPQQRTIACQLLSESGDELRERRREAAARRDRSMNRTRGMRGGMAADSALALNRPVWSFCTDAPPAAPAARTP